MEKVTLDQARNAFDAMVEKVRKTKEPITVTGPGGDLVRVVPVSQPAYYFKGRPVYTEEQLASMDSRYPDESAWVEDILKHRKAE
ncbi:MAG TPA: type II toxin-antitoxin system Phd/YefM family antitoxin [Planctomycetota bacterium]|jgi:prevent-host-death family protein